MAWLNGSMQLEVSGFLLTDKQAQSNQSSIIKAAVDLARDLPVDLQCYALPKIRIPMQ